MRPMALLAAGILFVGVDLRFGQFDVLPDVLGWVLCAVAAFQVRDAGPWFQFAMVVAAAGVLLSLRGSIRSSAVEVLDSLEIVVQTVVVFAVCSGIIDRLRGHPGADPAGDRSASTQANLIRWSALALSLVSLVLVLSTRSTRESVGTAVPLALLVVMAGLALVVWFLLLLFRVRDHPSLQPVDVPA